MYIEFKPGEKYASAGADIADSPDMFENCGYLLTDDDLIIDIDCLPKRSIESLIKTFDIQTQTVWTDRGVHFYFRRPDDMKRATNGVCRLGFKIEKFTRSARPKGVTVKRNGILRKIENEGAREDVPSFFAVSKRYKDMTGMDEGDGRNETLYSHKMALKNCEDWFRCLKFVNENVFAKPLETKEFETLARTENIKNEADTPELRVAKELMNTRKVTKWSAKLWFWDYEKKRFITDDHKLNKLIFDKLPVPKPAKVKEVFDTLDIAATQYDVENVFPIQLKNGCLYKGKFLTNISDEFTPYSICVEYDEQCEPVKDVDDYIAQLVSAKGYDQKDVEAYRKFLLEVMAYGLIVDPDKTSNLAKFFIFRGEGANGKGTLLKILRQIYNPENCSYLSITDIGDMHYIPSMIGKLVNLGDDIEDAPINKSQFKYIKNITSADDIEVRLLYRQPEHAKIQAKLIFTSNSDIRTYDKGYALERRMCWMPMFNKVEKPDSNFLSKMTTPEALKYWIYLIVEAYKRLYKNGWTKSKICEDYNAEYHRCNNLTLMFVEDMTTNGDADVFQHHTRSEVKEMYENWKEETSLEDDRRPLNKNQFDQIIWTKFQMGYGKKKVDGKPVRAFVYQKDTTQDVKPKFKV